MSDGSDMGRFGAIAFLRSREPEKVIASYPVDSEVTTIGRDPFCDIRLYYPEVSGLHAKLVIENRKAFLVVYGQNGVLVDDCPVFPQNSSSRANSNGAPTPSTVPLPNAAATFEIHTKRFRFAYPPKGSQGPQAVVNTPGPSQPKRALRLSLIRSAQVFSPRPSSDPLENLRTLQSPLRPFSGSSRTLARDSPLKKSTVARGLDEAEEEIVLVQGNHPRVLQEDKDLVITESVEREAEPAAQTMAEQQMQAHRARPPQTPQRKGRGPRSSLHRAVLLRSAQRVLREEREREEEEMEVEDTVLEEAEEAEHQLDEESDEELQELDEDEAEETGSQSTPKSQTSGWRRSLGAMWPFGRGTSVEAEAQHHDDPEEDEAGEDEEAHVEEHETAEDDEGTSGEGAEEEAEPDDIVAGEDEEVTELSAPEAPSTPHGPVAPARRLGSFMTPQAAKVGAAPAPFATVARPNAAPLLTPRRAERPWRVRDLVVPISEEITPPRAESNTTRQVEENTAMSPAKNAVSDEQAKAIRERRRQSIIPSDPFAGTGLVSSPFRATANTARPPSPTKPFLRPVSPSKLEATSTPGPSSIPEHILRTHDDSPEEDTNAMLDHMRKTVDRMRRRSMDFRASLGGEHLREESTSPKKGQFLLFPREEEEVKLKRGPLDFSSVGEESMELDDSMSGDAPSLVLGHTRVMQDETMELDQEDDAGLSDEVYEGLDDESDKENAGSRPASALSGMDDHLVEEEDAEDEHYEHLPDDADEAKELPPSKSKQPSSGAVPATPHTGELRHLFRAPEDTATPRMDGLRNLYRTAPPIPNTPAMDGVADMLATPTGYGQAVEKAPGRAAGKAQKATSSTAGHSVQPRAPSRVGKVASGSVPAQRAVSGPKTHATGTVDTTRFSGVSNASAGASTSRAAGVSDTSRATGTGRITPTGRVTPTDAAARRLATCTDNGTAPVVTVKAKATRTITTTRSVDSQSSSAPATAASKARQAKLKDATDSVEDDEEEAPIPVPRRTRTNNTDTSAPATRAGRSKSRTAPASSQGDNADPARTRRDATKDKEAAAAAAKTPAIVTRRATRSTPAPDEEAAEDVSIPAATRAKRSTRAKTTSTDVKDEEEDVAIPEASVQPAAAARSAATKRGVGARAPSSTSIEASATRSRSTSRKGVVSTDPDDGVASGDKENTPETRVNVEGDPAPARSASASKTAEGAAPSRVKRTNSTASKSVGTARNKEDPPVAARGVRSTSRAAKR